MIQRYNIYVGPSRDAINYSSPVVRADHPATQVAVTQPPGSERWYALRAENDAGQEANGSIILYCRIEPDGRLVGPVPNPPRSPAALALAGGRVRLTWAYDSARQEAPPAEFRVYGDGGGGVIDYDTPVAVVPYVDRVPWYCWQSGPLDHGTEYRFAIRAASAAGDEELNLDFVEVVADAEGPPAHDTWLLEAGLPERAGGG